MKSGSSQTTATPSISCAAPKSSNQFSGDSMAESGMCPRASACKVPRSCNHEAVAKSQAPNARCAITLWRELEHRATAVVVGTFAALPAAQGCAIEVPGSVHNQPDGQFAIISLETVEHRLFAFGIHLEHSSAAAVVASGAVAAAQRRTVQVATAVQDQTTGILSVRATGEIVQHGSFAASIKLN